MKKYDYMETVKTDAINWVRKNVNIKDFENLDSLRRYTLCQLSRIDSVTGGNTGKYTGTEYSIEEAIAHIEQNITLYHEAIKEITSPDPRDETSFEEMDAFYREEPFYCDYIIRLYCIQEIIDTVILEAIAAPLPKKPEKYDYVKAVKEDVMEWAKETIDFTAVDDIASLKKYIFYNTYESDYITGADTHIYRPYMDIPEVERAIGANLDLLVEAILSLKNDLGDNEAEEWLESNKDDPHALDTMIRCYLLPDAVDQVVEELLPEIEKSQASES